MVKAKCMMCGKTYELVDKKDKRNRGFDSQWCEDQWDEQYSSRPTTNEIKRSVILASQKNQRGMTS